MEKLIAISIVALIVALLVITLPLWYVKAPPDRAFIITGLGKRKIIIGKAGIKIPFLQRVDKLDLSLTSVDVKTDSYVPTNDFINVKIDGAVKIKISKAPELLDIASQNFLNKNTEYITAQVKDVLEGNTREIIGSMAFKDIVQDRKAFVDKVQENAVPDLERMGLELVSFNVQSVVDEHNVIVDLGIDNISKIQKDAKIAKAIADKEVAIATATAQKESNDVQVQTQAEIAQKQKELAIKKAEYKQEQDTKQAEADAAYDIQKEIQRSTIEAKTAEANLVKTEKQIEIQQAVLRAEIEKQADAELYKRQKDADAEAYERIKDSEARLIEKQKEAEGIRAIGQAEAEAIKLKGLAEAEGINAKADAMKKYGEAAVLEMYFNALPEIAKSVAMPLSNVDKITMYGDAQNSKLIKDIVNSTTQITDGLLESTGIDVQDMIGKLISKKIEPSEL